MVNQYHGNLTPPRIAPSSSQKETEVSLYPTFTSWQSTAPHGCLVSLVIARSDWRSWRQKTRCFEKRGKIRSTELFSFQGTSEGLFLYPSLYNGQFETKMFHRDQIKFLSFSRISFCHLHAVVLPIWYFSENVRMHWRFKIHSLKNIACTGVRVRQNSSMKIFVRTSLSILVGSANHDG